MAKGTKTATKLKSLKMIDGKVEPDSRTFANIKTIDEAMGIKPQGAFKATSLAQFEQQIDKEMNLADMQQLASRVGLIPLHDRPLLKKRLIDEFKKDLKKKTGYGFIDSVAPMGNLKEEMSDKAQAILKQGR